MMIMMVMMVFMIILHVDASDMLHGVDCVDVRRW
jgi:hypothetical protein